MPPCSLIGATASSPVLSADAYENLYDAGPGPLAPQNVFEGWYLGGTLGGATVNYDFSPATGDVDTSGILGGVVGGWSLQSGPFVIGIEGDVLAADISGSRNFNAGLNKVSPSIDTMADLRLRAGYTVTPRVLLFGTFGGAWANAELPVTGPGGGVRERRFLRLERWRRRGGTRSIRTGRRASTISSPISSPRRSDIRAARSTYDPDANTFRGSLIYRF